MKNLLCLTYCLCICITYNTFGQGNIKFDYRNAVYHPGEYIQFLNLSGGSYADSTFYWEFGEDCGLGLVYDSKTCALAIKGLKSVSHIFKYPGKFKVTLKTKSESYSEFIEILIDESYPPPYSLRESFDNNLIVNSGFESYINCPSKPGQIYYSTGWYSPSPATPDYFNSCYRDKTVYDWRMDVPLNFAGFSQPKDGNAYAGIITYIIEDTAKTVHPDPNSKYFNYREYLETRLNKPMIAGRTYAVQLYIKLSRKSRIASTVGLHLSTDEVIEDSSRVLSEMKPILNINLNSDTGWVLIADTIKADKNYEYLIIGNFNDDFNSVLKDIRPDTLISSKYGGFKAYASYCYIDAVIISNIFNEIQERSVIGTSGGTFANTEAQIDFTVGQRAFHTLATQSIICTQGFQQPDESELAFRLIPANSLIMNSIEISAYPNPFVTKINIEIINKLKSGASLQIFDLLGNKYISEVLNINDSKLFRYQVDLSFLSSGVYTLVISNNKDIGTYKLVKQ